MLNTQTVRFFLLISLALVCPSLEVHINDVIKSCLTVNRVTNFTTFPDQSDNNSSSLYYNLLNFSIQNLRFAEPTFSKPVAIVLPGTKEQLANTVLCCRKASLAIRIRSGGHSYEGLSSVGSTSDSQFVIIDMMNLNQVSVDIQSKTAWVQGGATLGETYYAIAESSRSYGFSAGSCPTVGSGGHIAGGGFGLLSRKYGLASDNVVDAILIDANGRSLDREAMGEEVFWAIRGGGGGVWGVIYAWKIQLLHVPKIVTSFIVSRPGSKGHIAKLVHKWQTVGPHLEGEFYLSVFVGAGLPEAKTKGSISATFKGFYLGPKKEAILILSQVFPELGVVVEDCTDMSWIESILYFSGLEKGSSISNLKDRYFHDKGYFKAKSDYVKSPIPMRGIRVALDILEKEPKGYVILDPYGGFMNTVISTSTPFPHRDGNLFTIQYLVDWNKDDITKNAIFLEWIRWFYSSMTPFVSKGPRSAYVNYLDLDLGEMSYLNSRTGPIDDAVDTARAWGEKYFLRNYDRLVLAKTIIDPENVFNNPQGIPPMSTPSLDAQI
ncbi:hypothetical protein GIB67_033226 [Kingdonia uniflora]|uniref:FAD-binding PCMH-type domain-containing protein n=1 Tax=Kingdonia uniflora TaxID=39325 RepID=A0A7J7MPL2_9MAGN|nr:hypothetical protein GIB67_033226 [Kingdonia uniflora]